MTQFDPFWLILIHFESYWVCRYPQGGYWMSFVLSGSYIMNSRNLRRKTFSWLTACFQFYPIVQRIKSVTFLIVGNSLYSIRFRLELRSECFMLVSSVYPVIREVSSFSVHRVLRSDLLAAVHRECHVISNPLSSVGRAEGGLPALQKVFLRVSPFSVPLVTCWSSLLRRNLE